MTNKKWTEEEVKKLKDMSSSGYSLGEIHERFTHRTIGSVQNKLRKLNLYCGSKVNGKRREFWSKEDEDKLTQLYKKGISSQEIANKINRTVNSVNGKIHKLKLPELYPNARTYEDLSGQKYHMLTAVKRVSDRIEPSGKHRPMWEWVCECGNHIVASSDSVKYGGTKSCGCLQRRVGVEHPNKKTNDYYIYKNIVFVKYTNRDEYFLCDLEDWGKLKDGSWANRHGYAVDQNRVGETVFHRCIIDNMSEGLYVDHWHQVGLGVCDNRKKNLRVTDHQTNMMNQRLRSNNKTGYTGVCQNSKTGKWYAQIKINYTNKFLGYFDKKEDAIKTRLQAEHDLCKEFAAQWHLFKEFGIDDSDLDYFSVSLANPEIQKKYGYNTSLSLTQEDVK